jgi:hypothetical protein
LNVVVELKPELFSAMATLSAEKLSEKKFGKRRDAAVEHKRRQANSCAGANAEKRSNFVRFQKSALCFASSEARCVAPLRCKY